MLSVSRNGIDAAMEATLTTGYWADELHESNQLLTDRNDRLAAEVVDLKNGLDAIEERGRNDLGMIRNDEQFFWVPSEKASHNPTPVAPPGADQSADEARDQFAGREQ